MKNEADMQECYNKRLNLLVHGIEDNPWETREQTKDKLNQFFIDGLKLNPQSFSFVDLHRLPQRPVTTGGVKKDGPIILKLSNAFEKHTIVTSLKNLKDYNQHQVETRQGMTSKSSHLHSGQQKVYVSEHLPSKLLQQKKKVHTQFKEAREVAIEEGNYCLDINSIKYITEE